MDNVPNESVSLVVTSPPYFDAKDYGSTGKDNIGDSGEEVEAYKRYLNLMEKVYREAYNKLKFGGHMVINVADVICNAKKYPVNIDTGKLLLNVFNNSGYLDTILWQKPAGMSSQKRFGIFIQQPYPKYFRPNNMYEPWFVFVKGKKNYDFDKEANKLDWTKFKEYQTDIWQVQPETSKGKVHPAPFPYKLPYLFIQLFTCKGETVLEPFLGSGTTMKAARDLGRNSFGYELNPNYIDKAIKPELGIENGMQFKPDLINTIYAVKDLQQNEYIIALPSTMNKQAETPPKEQELVSKPEELSPPKEVIHIKPQVLPDTPEEEPPAWDKMFGPKKEPEVKIESSVKEEGDWEDSFGSTKEKLVRQIKKESQEVSSIPGVEGNKAIHPKEPEPKVVKPWKRYVCLDCFSPMESKKELAVCEHCSGKISFQGDFTCQMPKEEKEEIIDMMD